MAANSDCSNILLSFLSDVGEDWSDSFIFPDTELSLHTDVGGFLTKELSGEVDNAKTSIATTDGAMSACTTRESSVNSAVAASFDEKDFEQSLDSLFDFSNGVSDDIFTADDMFADAYCLEQDNIMSMRDTSSSFRSSPSSSCPGSPSQYSAKCPSVLIKSNSNKMSTMTVNVNGTQFEQPIMTSQIGMKRDREESTDDPRNAKATVNQKITAVCGMLNQYRSWKKQEEEKDRRMAAKRFRYTTPIDTATSYLQSLFNSKPVTPQELLKMSSSGSVLSCKALSSLVQNSQSKKAMAKLSAWMPVGTSSNTSEFPENHTGIGQTAAASRAFTSAMNDVLGHSLMSKLKFDVHIPSESAITSKFGDKLSAPFVFKSEGMIALGYPEELEFNGSITCNFVKEGIQNASVYFDACKIIREQSKYNEVRPVQTSVSGL